MIDDSKQAADRMTHVQGRVISNPCCSACGTVADGILDYAMSNNGFYICPNLNCENEWRPSDVG